MFLAARLLFIGSLLAAPWLFGGAETYLISWLVWPLAASLLLMGGGWLINPGDRRLHAPLLVVPVLLGALLGVAQLAPMFGPEAAPSRAAELRAEFAADPPDGPTPATLSTAATRRQVAWLVVAASVVLVGANLFRSPIWRRRLMAAVAVNGAALALLAILQLATWQGRVYWVGPEVTNGSTAIGPFVYHNQAGAYFATCAACLLGWLLLDRTSSPTFGSRSQLRRFQAAVGICLLAGLLASFSRGALLATLGAGAAAAFIAGGNLRLRAIVRVAAPLALGVVALLVWTSLDTRVTARIASLADAQTYQQDNRLEHWPVALRAAADFWGIGAGLGAYEHVNPLYEQQPGDRDFQRAHNQYLEALVDGGAPALFLLLAAVGVAGVAFVSAAHSTELTDAAVGVAAFAALSFQVLHGMVDYCLYLPANLILFAAIAGLGVGAARNGVPAAARRRLPTGLWLAPVAAACVMAAVVLHNHARVDRAIQDLPWSENDATLAAADVGPWIAGLTEATKRCPDDADAWQALGEALVLRYRLQARDTLAAEFDVPPDNPALWELTRASQLLTHATNYRRDGQPELLAELRQQELVAANLPAARDAFAEARRVGPLLPRPLLRLMSLSWLDTDTPTAPDAVEHLMRLAPMKPAQLYEAGRLAYLSGDYTAAWRPWRRCLTIAPDYGPDIVDLAAVVLPAEQLVDLVLPAEPVALFRVHTLALANYRRSTMSRLALRRAVALLTPNNGGERPPLTADEWRLLGRLHATLEESAEAAAAYEAAVDRRPTQVEWRYEFGAQLLASGRLEEAEEEALFCVRMGPGVARYDRLLRDVREALTSAPQNGVDDTSGKRIDG